MKTYFTIEVDALTEGAINFAESKVNDLVSQINDAPVKALASYAVRRSPQVGVPRTAGEASPHGLSERETQVLAGLMVGQSNKMIAIDMDITEATVKVHLKSLLRKIGCTNRTQAAIWGHQNLKEAA
jgi:DNA-binding NarL/FixJ family response regulator